MSGDEWNFIHIDFGDEDFIGPIPATKDALVDLNLSDSEVIGAYTMPTVYRTGTPQQSSVSKKVDFFQTTSTISGVETVLTDYFSSVGIFSTDVITSLVDFCNYNITTSGTNDIELVYFAGNLPVSGSLNRRLSFVAGYRNNTWEDTQVNLYLFTVSADSFDKEVDYMNFTGDITSSGTPVANYDFYKDILSIYTQSASDNSSEDRLVDIHFAGYPSYVFDVDLFSSDLSLGLVSDLELTTRSGNVQAHYLDLFSCGLKKTALVGDLFCSLMDFSFTLAEVETISGSVTPINNDIFSCGQANSGIGFNVDLYSLKIDNFSLGIGEYTTASGYISFDVLDDECPVSVSGTYLTVSGTKVSTTYSSVTDGYRFYYNPTDDFESLLGPTLFKVHAENVCGNKLEREYYLVFGYFVEYTPRPYYLNQIDYGYNEKVLVRVTAEDFATCPSIDSLAWEFETRDYYRRDLSANIVCKRYGAETRDLSAEIYPLSTAYYYGKEFTVTINAKDFSGNTMKPYVLTYKIENKPS